MDTSTTLPSAGTAGAAAAAWGRGGRREWRPLPSALRGSFLLIGEDFFRELDVGFGAAGTRVVGEDRFAVAGRFGQTDVPGDDGFEDVVLEEFAKVGGD